MISTLAERLKELRNNKRLRQEQVASLIGVNKSAVCFYENGTRQPSYDILLRLANLYRVSVDYLLGQTSIRSVDLTGLSDKEAAAIIDLVDSLKDKNKRLEKYNNW